MFHNNNFNTKLLLVLVNGRDQRDIALVCDTYVFESAMQLDGSFKELDVNSFVCDPPLFEPDGIENVEKAFVNDLILKDVSLPYIK